MTIFISYGCQLISMSLINKRSKLERNDEEIEYLSSLSHSRTKPVRTVEKAKILLLSYHGKNDSQIANELNSNRQKVIRCVRLLPMGFKYKQVIV